MDGQITQGQAACMKRDAKSPGMALEGAKATWLFNSMRFIQSQNKRVQQKH